MTYGPFPLRVWRLLGGIVATALGVFTLLFMLTPETLTCAAPGGVCIVERPLAPQLRFPRSRLHGVRVEERRGSKGGKFGLPILELDGHDLELRQVSPDEAARFQQAVEAGLPRNEAFEVALRESWWAGVLFLLMLAMGLGLSLTSVRGIGRYRLQANPFRRDISVTRMLLGVVLGRWTVSTNGVVDVEVEWKHDKDFFHSRHERGDTEGRLVLVATDGERRPINPRFHRGYTLHRRAAEKLRAELGCPARSAEATARQEDAALVFHPPPGAFQNMGIFASTWIGMCCGSLLGMVVYAVVGVALGFLSFKDPVDEYAMIFGAGGGALAGIAFTLYLSRSHPPR